MNFMHLHHKPQYHGRHRLIKKCYFISILSPRLFLVFQTTLHCWLIFPFKCCYAWGGFSSKDTILLYVCTYMNTHPFHINLFTYAKKSSVFLKNTSLQPACLYPSEINCILLLLCIVFLYACVCFYLTDCSVKTRKSIKRML